MTNTIPPSILPECWNDETRINVLFAPFRSRTVNPQDWDNKLSFWRKLISSYCFTTKTFSFKLSDLKHVFIKDGRTPSCLPVVIDEMHKNGDLKTIEEFSQKQPLTWLQWSSNIIKKPVSWSYNLIKNSIFPKDSDVTYVHLPAIKEHSDSLRNFILKKYKGTTLDLNELSEYTKEINIDLPNLRLLLRQLEKDGYATTKTFSAEDSNNLLVKISDVKKYNLTITNTEVDVYTLQRTEKFLANDIAKLESEVTAIVSKIKSYLLKGHKQSAKTCLRKKHEIEKRILKRMDVLYNIQAILSKVQDVSVDSHVLDSYRTAINSLKTTFKETGLSEEKIVNTMLELEEVFETCEDINKAISHPISDEDIDLEKELAEILDTDDKNNPGSSSKEEINLEEVTKDLHNLHLPEVPFNEVRVKSKISL